MTDMIYRRLGPTGLQVSVISLGAWLTYGSSAVGYETAAACIRTAIENGINFIDVADIYARGEAEKTVGQIIKNYDRDKLVISTKAYWPMSDDVNDRGLSRKHIMQSVENSLRRFDMDYVDIFFCHRYDMYTPTEETVRAIEDLIRAGKILYWGTSMWTAQQIQEAVDAADKYLAYRPVVEQPKYNMLDRHVVEGALEAKVDEHDIGLTVFSPLAGGVLTGKYNDGVPAGSRVTQGNWAESDDFAPHRLDKARALTELAQAYGYTPAALAIAWAMHHSEVDSVITGASKPEHVLSNLDGLKVNLTSELEDKIEAILRNKPRSSFRPTITPDEVPAL